MKQKAFQPGESEMYSRFCKIILALCMIYISVFVSLEIPVQSLEYSVADEQKQEVVASKTGKHIDFQNMDSWDFLQHQAVLKVECGRRMKAGLSKISVLFCLIFSASAVFFAWAFLKKVYGAYLQSYFYPLARFLCDLVIQQKKDGKKRAAFI